MKKQDLINRLKLNKPEGTISANIYGSARNAARTFIKLFLLNIDPEYYGFKIYEEYLANRFINLYLSGMSVEELSKGWLAKNAFITSEEETMIILFSKENYNDAFELIQLFFSEYIYGYIRRKLTFLIDPNSGKIMDSVIEYYDIFLMETMPKIIEKFNPEISNGITHSFCDSFFKVEVQNLMSQSSFYTFNRKQACEISQFKKAIKDNPDLENLPISSVSKELGISPNSIKLHFMIKNTKSYGVCLLDHSGFGPGDEYMAANPADIMFPHEDCDVRIINGAETTPLLEEEVIQNLSMSSFQVFAEEIAKKTRTDASTVLKIIEIYIRDFSKEHPKTQKSVQAEVGLSKNKMAAIYAEIKSTFYKYGKERHLVS